MKKFKKVLLLTDTKKSSINQVNATKQYLSSYMNSQVKFKEFVVENFNIPNILILFLIRINLIRLKKSLFTFRPELIISCGRVTAPFSISIKKEVRCKNIHILNPYISHNYFDLILVPKHDDFPNGKHIIKFNGALVNRDNFKIKNPDKKIIFENLKIPSQKQIVTILVGGDYRGQSYKLYEINKFISYVEKLLENKNYFLCFLFSRRTSKKFQYLIKKKFSKSSFIWDGITNNPFWYLLSNSNYIVVTGDSISMTSEAIESGKPVFVYMPKKIKKKFQKFHNYNFTNGFAFIFEGQLRNVKINTNKFQSCFMKQISKYTI